MAIYSGTTKIKKIFAGTTAIKKVFAGSALVWNSREVVKHGTTTSLSQARRNMAGASTTDYAIFLGGCSSDIYTIYTNIDAYNSSLVKATNTNTFYHMQGWKGTSLNNYAIFAQGRDEYGTGRSYVEAYSNNLTRSVLAKTSAGAYHHGACSVGNYALFAGGTTGSQAVVNISIYNSSLTKIDFPPSFVTGRIYTGTANVGNYAIFMGGRRFNGTVVGDGEVINNNLVRSTIYPSSSNELTGTVNINGKYALFSQGSYTQAFNTSLVGTSPSSDVLDQPIGVSLGEFGIMGGGYNTAICNVYDDNLVKTRISDFTTVSRINTYGTAVRVGDYAIFAGDASVSSTVEAYKIC